LNKKCYLRNVELSAIKPFNQLIKQTTVIMHLLSHNKLN
jgi:hypothetical protein